MTDTGHSMNGSAHRLQADMPTGCVLFLIVIEKTAIYMPGINPKSGMRPRVSFWSQKVIISARKRSHVGFHLHTCATIECIMGAQLSSHPSRSSYAHLLSLLALMDVPYQSACAHC